MSSVPKIRRLLHLLERLQSGRTHNAGELADFCRVSRRTMFRDLKSLQDSGVQVLYDPQRQGYWIPGAAALPPTELTLAETLSLIVLSQETQSSRGIPFQEAARDAALKLQSNLPHHLAQYAAEVASAVQVHSEPQANLKNGRTSYERLLEGATRKRKVRIRYDSLAEQTELVTLLSPDRLLFRRHAWYAIGRSSLHRSIRTFHLGRIQSAELTDDSFEIPARFSIQRYFGQAWNMIREPHSRSQVTVRFSSLVARNVAEVAWHPTQQVRWNDDGTMDFTVEVDGIQEISWWIMSYGDQAEVQTPLTLRRLLAERAQRMCERYREEVATTRTSKRGKSKETK